MEGLGDVFISEMEDMDGVPLLLLLRWLIVPCAVVLLMRYRSFCEPLGLDLPPKDAGKGGKGRPSSSALSRGEASVCGKLLACDRVLSNKASLALVSSFVSIPSRPDRSASSSKPNEAFDCLPLCLRPLIVDSAGDLNGVLGPASLFAVGSSVFKLRCARLTGGGITTALGPLESSDTLFTAPVASSPSGGLSYADNNVMRAM